MKPIAAAFFFLSTLCVHQFIVVSGQSTTNTADVNVKLIEEACQHAPQMDHCVNTLKNDPNSKGADLTGLAFIAIRLAAAYAADVDEHLRSLLINNATALEPAVQQGVTDCTENYSDANEQLDDCIAAMSMKNFKDVETWVNVAISDADACDNSLSGQKSVVSQKNEEFRQLCNNVLAIINVLETRQKR